MFQLLGFLLRGFAAARAFGGTASVWRRIAAWWHAWHQRAVDRRELRAMDDSTLRDLGLSHRAAAESPRVRDML